MSKDVLWIKHLGLGFECHISEGRGRNKEIGCFCNTRVYWKNRKFLGNGARFNVGDRLMYVVREEWFLLKRGRKDGTWKNGSESWMCVIFSVGILKWYFVGIYFRGWLNGVRAGTHRLVGLVVMNVYFLYTAYSAFWSAHSEGMFGDEQ